MLSRAKLLSSGLGAQCELLEDEVVDPDEEHDSELTRCVVSEADCGLSIRGTAFPLTGELPEVNPSSAELECRPLFTSSTVL